MRPPGLRGPTDYHSMIIPVGAALPPSLIGSNDAKIVPIVDFAYDPLVIPVLDQYG